MKPWLVFLVAVAMAGCADDAAPAAEEPDEVPEGRFDDQTGAIRGVVVDDTINPVAGATVSYLDGEPVTAQTDATGAFVFDNVAPGTYILRASSPLHEPVQSSATVTAGTSTNVIKMQMPRLFEQDPFVSSFQFSGRLACHVQAGATAPCVTDFTQLVPPCGNGCFPELRTILGDARDFIGVIDGGWQAHVVEMTWEPSTSATSQSLGITVRDFEPGGANHHYANAGGASPLLLRIDCCESHPTQSGSESIAIPPEGYDNIIHFAGVRTEEGQFAALALEQAFEVFTNTFYYGIPPEGWSFINGSPNPF